MMNIVFTLHTKFRLKKRKITEDEVIQAIKSPDKLTKIDGKYYVQKNIGRGNIEVIYVRENYIKVVTVYWV